MNYKMRINGNSELEAPVKHMEQVDEASVIIDDIGEFKSPTTGYVFEKIELIGDDGEVYAMRKIPKHLMITVTPKMSLTFQWRLTIDKALA